LFEDGVAGGGARKSAYRKAVGKKGAESPWKGGAWEKKGGLIDTGGRNAELTEKARLVPEDCREDL